MTTATKKRLPPGFYRRFNRAEIRTESVTYEGERLWVSPGSLFGTVIEEVVFAPTLGGVAAVGHDRTFRLVSTRIGYASVALDRAFGPGVWHFFDSRAKALDNFRDRCGEHGEDDRWCLVRPEFAKAESSTE